MAAVKQTVEHVASLEKYKHGFVSDIEQDFAPKGLNADIVRFISAKKDEPQWMLDWRLDAFERWLAMDEPDWAKVNFPRIDYQDSYYYAAPKEKVGPKSLDEVDPDILEVYKKLGIPLREQEVLAGVEGAPRYAVDAVFDSVSVVTTFKKELAQVGVIFSNAPDEYLQPVAAFGEKIGIAFQLIDDVIDLASTKDDTGKTPGTDLRAGVATLPLLYLPGWALGRRIGAPVDPLARHYERVAASALWSGVQEAIQRMIGFDPASEPIGERLANLRISMIALVDEMPDWVGLDKWLEAERALGAVLGREVLERAERGNTVDERLQILDPYQLWAQALASNLRHFRAVGYDAEAAAKLRELAESRTKQVSERNGWPPPPAATARMRALDE